MNDKAIWKFTLTVTDRQIVEMPIGAKILSVADQHGMLCLWAECYASPSAAVERQILIVGTGHPLPPNRGNFIGTVLMGSLVWHVYEAA